MSCASSARRATRNISPSKVPDTGGVYLVPAFTGLGAPHWDMYARGTMVGITRGTSRSISSAPRRSPSPIRSMDLVDAMERDYGQIRCAS